MFDNKKVRIKDTKTVAEERKFFWISKVLIIFIVVAFISNAILFFVVMNIVPNTKIQPFFVEMKDLNNKVIIVKKNFDLTTGDKNAATRGASVANYYDINRDSPSFKIAEANIKKYIIQRESIFKDPDQMRKNWGLESDLYYYSSPEVFKAFVASELYKRIILNKNILYETNVTITAIDYQAASDQWVVDLDSKYLDFTGKPLEMPNSLNSKVHYRIIVSAKFDLNTDGIKKNEQNKYRNPLGFQITSYGLENK